MLIQTIFFFLNSMMITVRLFNLLKKKSELNQKKEDVLHV